MADVVGGAGAGGRRGGVIVRRPGELALVAVAAGEVAVAAVDVLDQEDGAVERVELEAREIRPEEGEAEAERAGRIFGADFIAVDRFGIELQIADQRLRAADCREGRARSERVRGGKEWVRKC